VVDEVTLRARFDVARGAGRRRFGRREMAPVGSVFDIFPLCRAVHCVCFAEVLLAPHDMQARDIAFAQIPSLIEQRFSLGVRDCAGRFHDDDRAEGIRQLRDVRDRGRALIAVHRDYFEVLRFVDRAQDLKRIGVPCGKANSIGNGRGSECFGGFSSGKRCYQEDKVEREQSSHRMGY